MKRLLKRSMCYFLCVTGMVGMFLPIAFSQEEEETKVEWGEIISIDSEKSEIVVKYVSDETSGESAEMTVKVDAPTLIECGENVISLAELKIGEWASIEYTTNEDGENMATYIWVEAEESVSTEEKEPVSTTE